MRYTAEAHFRCINKIRLFFHGVRIKKLLHKNQIFYTIMGKLELYKFHINISLNKT